MENLSTIIILSLLAVWLASCIPWERIETTQKLHRTGEFIAIDSLIKKYEGAHQKFIEEETNDGKKLEWPYLFNKNCSDFCKKYIQHALPGKTNEGTTGKQMKTTLHYEKENMSMTSRVVVIQCKVMGQSNRPCYYVTRAPEPTCVYSLKHTKCINQAIFTIINKYCEFESQPFISLKRKRIDIVEKMNRRTAQPIAKNEYLWQYELEHQELLMREGENDYQIIWPYATNHHNLEYFCHQYIRKCAPRKGLRNITGNWKVQKLAYQKLKTSEYIFVTTVTCVISNESKWQYHMTRAPERNWVYALLRLGRAAYFPLAIVFKHCDFENPNDQLTI